MFGSVVIGRLEGSCPTTPRSMVQPFVSRPAVQDFVMRDGVSGVRLYMRSFGTFAEQARTLTRVDRLDEMIVEPVFDERLVSPGEV